MESLSKWMVGLDLTQIDDSVLRYTKMLSGILKPQRIEFVHMASWLPDSVPSYLSDRVRVPDYEDLLEQVEKKVFKYFNGNDPIGCEVLEGSVQFDLWQATYTKEIDLFIVGSKEKHLGRGLFPKKFVRKSVCSVLFVPEKIPETLSKIWIPVDFSDASGVAFNLSLHLAHEVSPEAEVCVQHVYEMPHAYYYEGFPKDDVMRAVRAEAEKQYHQFSKKFNPYELEVRAVFTPMSKSYAAEHIYPEVEREQVSLVVAASGGRSRFSKLFLGSETEQLVTAEKKIPVLILKERKEQIKLWDILNP